jgi:hypothetical protein
MAGLKKEIKTYLIGQSIGASGTIFLDFIPDAPDDIIIISEYGGAPAGPGLVDRRIQIKVRNQAHSIGEALINSIVSTLDNYENPEQIITLSNGKIAIFRAIQTPVLIERDNLKRNIFVVNFQVFTTRD